MSTVFALPTENNFGDTVPNGVAGQLGLFITVLLVIATVLLIRNMNSRLRRLPERFPAQGDAGAEAAEDAASPAPAEESPKA
jgi:hypothetical protein